MKQQSMELHIQRDPIIVIDSAISAIGEMWRMYEFTARHNANKSNAESLQTLLWNQAHNELTRCYITDDEYEHCLDIIEPILNRMVDSRYE